MEANRKRSLVSKAIGKRLKPRTPHVNPARRAAALRQWADPKARRKIVAAIRQSKRAAG
jgi:hypothetical protein